MIAGMTFTAVIAIGLLACSVLWHRAHMVRMRLQTSLEEATSGHESLQRIARLAGRDLRDAALRLTGQAALLSAGDAASQGRTEIAASLAMVAGRCRMLADDLGAAGLPLTAASLHEERVELLACVREAIATVVASLAPGRRHFRLPPDTGSGSCVIWADPRALTQVLSRVIAEAAFNTRQDECISIFFENESGETILTVADEGCGTVSGDRHALQTQKSHRNIAATMALSRVLMEAHGGRLDVLATPEAGTRVSLVFPAHRRHA